MALGERHHFQSLLAPERPADLQFIAHPQPAIWLRRLAIHVHLAVPARFLGFGTCPEHARDIQPDIQPHTIAVIIHVDHFAASFYSSPAHIAQRRTPNDERRTTNAERRTTTDHLCLTSSTRSTTRSAAACSSRHLSPRCRRCSLRCCSRSSGSRRGAPPSRRRRRRSCWPGWSGACPSP